MWQRRDVPLILVILLLGLCQHTASDEVSEEVLASREFQRGVVVRDGRVVRRSMFYLDADGWTVVGRDAQGPYRCHKMLCAEDCGNIPWHWSAPPRFLTALSNAYGGRLMIRRGFYEIVKAGQTSWPEKSMPFDVSIESGADGMKVQQFGLVVFGEFALEHSLELDMTGNWTMESGRPADESTLQHVLTTASRLLIRGGYYLGNETAFLRAVELVEPRSVSAGEYDEGGSDAARLDAHVCGNSDAQCLGQHLGAASKQLTDAEDANASSDKGALERALQERYTLQVSGAQEAGTSTHLTVSESEREVSATTHASSEARKQHVEAEMQARRLGRIIPQDGRAARPTREQGGGGRGVEHAGYVATWQEVDTSNADAGLLSCTGVGSEAVGTQNRQPMQELMQVASDRGIPLNACLLGASAAFGLASSMVVFVQHGDNPQILPLSQIESVSTDSQGTIVFLGPLPLSGVGGVGEGGDGGVQPVLLRGCKMSAFDLDAMTSFFERVQEIVANIPS